MIFYKTFIFSILLFFSASGLRALEAFNIWRHPEVAEKNSVFVESGIQIVFPKEGFNDKTEYKILPLFFRLDYMLPIELPFGVGVFFYTPAPNFKSFGVRGSYHIDLRDPLLDVYFLYSFNCGFLLKPLLARYNDTPPTPRFFDYRLGLRRFFGSSLGFSIETGFRLESVFISLSVKLN